MTVMPGSRQSNKGNPGNKGNFIMKSMQPPKGLKPDQVAQAKAELSEGHACYALGKTEAHASLLQSLALIE